MRKTFTTTLAVAILIFTLGTAQAATTYISGWDGASRDADKSWTNDSLMCWAAAASNMLSWSGWTQPSLNTEDQIFQYYVNHWTNTGGNAYFGVDWWFDGTNDKQVAPGEDTKGWAQVDVAGGGFYNPPAFGDYYDFHGYKNDNGPDTFYEAMGDVAESLNAGQATSLSLQGSTGHAITVWGYDMTGSVYTGLWITDSDDRTEGLQHVGLSLTDEKWFLSGYNDDSYYISEVHGLAANPTPIPGAIWLLGSGLIGLVGLRRRSV